MATKQATADHLLEQLAATGPVTVRKMFGEYCLYLSEKPVGLVCDDRLYLKTTTAGRELVPDAAEATPYPGAKPHLVILSEWWGDTNLMSRLLQATFEELPRPKPKKK